MKGICVIFALCLSVINAENALYMGNGDIEKRNTLKSSDAYSESDYNLYLDNDNLNNHNPVLSKTKVSRHVYNANTRDSYDNLTFASTSDTNVNTTQQLQISPNVNNLPTSEKWEVPNGESFNAKLFEIMHSTAQQQNLVYSPISLQMLLAFIFTMSDGKLFEELAHVLEIPHDRAYVAKAFKHVLEHTPLNTPPTTLIMANKLYYDSNFGIIDYSIQNLAKSSFACELEEVDFLAPKEAAKTINSWVSEKTLNLIRDIITPEAISADTSALLLNSIYFKSEWMVKFSTYDTESQPFHLTKHKQVSVDMMYNEDIFRYGEFDIGLQASVVELPYNSSDLLMMLILPKDIDGLSHLESRLRHYDFGSISEKLKRETVTVRLPKFKVEFETDMIKPLQQMGLKALFNNAGSINLFKTQQKPLRVDQFKHKSFINVNEAGTEAAAVAVAKYIPLSIPVNMKYFIADHPFVFVIRAANTTLFIGHVVKF